MHMPQKTVSVVQLRSAMCCERCGTVSAYRWSLHHRIPRGMGGSRDPKLNEPANILHLCGSGTEGCHGLVESNRATAYEFGWLVRRGFEPSQVPFADLAGRWWLLHEDQKLPLEFGFTPPNPRQ
jgi:5-methylcytosine-specific restriction protein A